MSTQHCRSRTRIPLPCRYFHTAQGCPYGTSCKYDHYSNNPSYFNYIKQKLHQISKPMKPQKSNSNDKNIINIMVEAMQQCITQIIDKQFNTLYSEINSLKSIINQQNKLIKNNNNNNKHISAISLTKQFNKITKLLNKNRASTISNDKSAYKNGKIASSNINDQELNDICNKIQKQYKQLQLDRKTFETQITDLNHMHLNNQTTNNITKLSPPQKNSKRTKRKQLNRSNKSNKSNDNLFVFKPEIIASPIPVTMDQIVALPIPPKTKPNPIKKIIKTETNVIQITKTKTKSKKNMVSVIKNTQKKKSKRNNKNHRKKPCRSKKKRNYKQNNTDSSNILPVLHNINEMDWYQIIKSDSSDDDTNMTSEDVQKLDMLDSI